jgi:hypothetical protein
MHAIKLSLFKRSMEYFSPCAADGSMLCALCNRGILSAIDVVGNNALAGVRMLVPKYIL